MTGKRFYCAGLFLAALAAFSLAFGQPRLALADAEQVAAPSSAVQNLAKTEDGNAALTRLVAGMLAAGYSPEEVRGRLALLTTDEMVRLADNPEATTGGKFVGILLAAALAFIVALLVGGYFVAVEEPVPPAPQPPPAR